MKSLKIMDYFLSFHMVAGFVIFKLYPFISSMIYSFYDYNLFRTPTFTAFGNYKILRIR